MASGTLLAFQAFAADIVKVQDLPQAVQDTLARKFGSAQVVSVERDNGRNDYVYFTVTLREGKSDRKVTLIETGEVAEARP